ncbi:MAG: hypothetical protein MJZ36_00105 [Bacteroidaceae bacterium]|nr:hypothetical protein [Bacteroidaceae bacterium]
MKKTRIYAVSLAALAIAGCSDNEYIGDVNELHGGKAEINFSMKTPAMTRANELVGAAAAALLNSNFVVEGIKDNGTTQTEVFDHYNVNWTENTANTTESNSSDWEYVGIGKHGLSASSKQTIKYWDYAASQYDFIAFSYGKSNYEKAVLTEIDYTKLGAAVTSGTPVYTVTGNTDELAKTYIADLVTLYNRNGVSEYGSVVTPKFRSLGTKVRIAFYETIPGYSVKNVRFYSEAWDESTPTDEEGAAAATLFAASAIFPSATSKGTMSVYYPTVGWTNSSHGTLSPDYNQAHIKFAAGSGSDDALVTTKTFGALANMAAKEDAEKDDGNVYLGRTSATATYAGDVNATDHAYQTVLPLGTKDNLQIRIEYDLVPIDGAAEVIHVRDARAVVPAAYAEWKPNYAYTYIFKISDKTNGWVGVDGDGNVVEGLTPITFDAVVVDTEDGVQETITTVSTPSITTYQEGKVVTAYNEYKAGDVYASVMNGTTAVVLSSLTVPAGVAVYEATATDPKIITEALVQDQLNGTKHDTGITLTSCGYTIVSEVPAVDGNTLSVSACKFAVASSKTYVFMYTDGSKNYVKIIKVQ